MSIQKYLNYQLCYVKDGDCYFANTEPEKVWGDDWDDAPYEHNAGEPYSHREEYEVFRLKIDTGNNLLEPCEYHTNSPYSVQDINRKRVSWLRTAEWIESHFVIHAGTTVKDFVKTLQSNGYPVYVELENSIVNDQAA